jgi:hypothetical protein
VHTPHIDALADSGVKLSNHYVQVAPSVAWSRVHCIAVLCNRATAGILLLA